MHRYPEGEEGGMCSEEKGSGVRAGEEAAARGRHGAGWHCIFKGAGLVLEERGWRKKSQGELPASP